MIITRELAQPILDKLEDVLDNPVNIINREGTIVASTDPARIGSFHQGAAEAMLERKNLLVYPSQTAQLAGTREGVTLPLEFHGEIVGAVGITGEPDDLQHVASIIKVAVISLIEQANLIQQSNYKRKLMDNWVGSLTSEDGGDGEYLRKNARFLGLDVKKHCSIVIISIRPSVLENFSTYEQYISQIIQEHAKIHFYSCTWHGHFVFAVRARTKEDIISLHPMCEDVLKKLKVLGHECFIGVGRPCSGIPGYRQSFFEAMHSIRLLEHLSDEKKIIYYYEHRILRLLEYLPDHVKQDFTDSYLDGRESDPALFTTLQAYFNQDRRTQETADELHIHRNTLIFRLNKIRDLYGLDPRSFRDAVTLQIILYTLKFPGAMAGKPPLAEQRTAARTVPADSRPKPKELRKE